MIWKKSILYTSCLFAQLLLVFGQAFESSNLPIVLIDTRGMEIVDDPKIVATMRIIDNGDGNRNQLTDPANDYDGFIGIELRGQTSQFLFEKKSFGIELRTETGEDLKAPILGMPAEEDWILYGAYSDKSLMRNFLAFHLWSATERYGSRTRFCEVVINGDYRGVYLMMEKIKRDNNRVDIATLNPDENTGDDLTGGFILKIDKTNDGKPVRGWVSPYFPPKRLEEFQQIFLQIDVPKPEEVSDPQASYIEAYVTAFEQSLLGVNFRDPNQGYREYANVSSFVDYALLTELTRNVDGYRLSTFLFKDKNSNGGLLNIGPPWDYNLAFGNADYCQGGNPTGWAWDFNEVCPWDYWLNPFWWTRLVEDDQFVVAMKLRWRGLREGPYSNESILTTIDSVANMLEEAQQRNFERWPVLGIHIWPNNFVGSTYASEVNYLKNWITQRLAWLDTEIESFEAVVGLSETSTEFTMYPNPAGKHLTLQCDVTVQKVEILSMQGVQVNVSDLAKTNPQLDVSMLSNGVYILRAYLENGEVLHRLLEKQD